MGDSSNGDNCDKFIAEFGDDVIKRYRSKILDTAFGEAVRYYIGVDDVNWITSLYAVIRTGSEKDEEEFIVPTGGNIFYPDWDEGDMVESIMELLDIDDDEARRRLVKAGLLEEKPCTCAALNGPKGCPAHDPGEPTLLDYAAKRVGSTHVEDVIGGRAKCGICGYIDDADPKDPIIKEWHGDSFELDDFGPEGEKFVYRKPPEPVVVCKLCHQPALAKTAHLHQGEYIGECCWDERLRSTE